MRPVAGDSRTIPDVVFYYRLNDGGPICGDFSALGANPAPLMDGSSS